MTSDMCIQEEGISKGYILVGDMNGVVLGHLTRISLIVMKKLMFYLQVSFNFFFIFSINMT